MNERIQALWNKAAESTAAYPSGQNNSWETQVNFMGKFAELIVAESINLLKREWYALNNAPAGETETPRDIGLRVGARDQTGHLINVIERHFGVEE